MPKPGNFIGAFLSSLDARSLQACFRLCSLSESFFSGFVDATRGCLKAVGDWQFGLGHLCCRTWNSLWPTRSTNRHGYVTRELKVGTEKYFGFSLVGMKIEPYASVAFCCPL
eukprot:5154831-Amphidinium_carterae.1